MHGNVIDLRAGAVAEFATMPSSLENWWNSYGDKEVRVAELLKHAMDLDLGSIKDQAGESVLGSREVGTGISGLGICTFSILGYAGWISYRNSNKSIGAGHRSGRR